MNSRNRRILTVLLGMVCADNAIAAPSDASDLPIQIRSNLDKIYPSLEELYREIHAHPELGFQENRTASLLATRMRALGFTVTEHVGKTGIVAIFKNGEGPTVLVRTELDALPLEEKTALIYASHSRQIYDGKLGPVAHACGHDIHMAWWVGAAQTLLTFKSRWHGTLMFIGQPAEELGSGAKAMLADGLYTRFLKPDFAFAAHVGPQLMGTVVIKQGVESSAADTVNIVFHGVGAHGSMPNEGIDPIVEAAHFVSDVQTVISRQKDPQKFGVVTVGAFNAGTAPNIIPDSAKLKLTLRSFDPEVRALLLRGVTSTAYAEAEMAGAPVPDIDHTDGVASVINDSALAGKIANTLAIAFGSSRVTLVPESSPGSPPSEDFSEFVAADVPHALFIIVGGSDPKMLSDHKTAAKPIPVNHSPYFAPVPEPTIKSGSEALVLAVLDVAGN